MPGMVEHETDNSQVMLNYNTDNSMLNDTMNLSPTRNMPMMMKSNPIADHQLRGSMVQSHANQDYNRGGYSDMHTDNSLNISNQPVIQGRPVVKKGSNMVVMPLPKKSGLEKLRDLDKIFIKQKFELLEMLTGCETENRYKVYAADENMEKMGDPIFKCKEKSNFFARNCLSGDCRPFQMKVIHEEVGEDEELDQRELFLWLDRPCKFTLYCLNRPEITVTLKENGLDKYIGKVVSQWACFDMVFEIFDREDKLVYKIHGSCCQWGLFCNCPCDQCAKIQFNVLNIEGQPVGEIYKIYSGVMKELFTDTDNFCCVFPPTATPEHKALLLASVLFIDFRYFEVAPQQNNNNAGYT
jgi:hypothetical protein